MPVGGNGPTSPKRRFQTTSTSATTAKCSTYEVRVERPQQSIIWIKYKQYHLSALLDTGSDVTIAREDVAEKMGWQIVEHRIKQVRVANNEPMCISGAVYVDLTVGSRTVMSEILITPNRKGLILGIDWLRQQGYFQWDFDKGRIRFGEEDWIELCQEKRSIRRIRPVL